MSALMKLNAEQLHDLSAALEQLTEITAQTGVSLTPHGRTDIGIGDNSLSINWDSEREQYVIDDVNGY